MDEEIGRRMAWNRAMDIYDDENRKVPINPAFLYGDPLEHLQKVARNLGILKYASGLIRPNITRESKDSFRVAEPNFCSACLERGAEYKINRINQIYILFDIFAANQDFLDYMDGRVSINGRYFASFGLDSRMDDLGEHATKSGMTISYAELNLEREMQKPGQLGLIVKHDGKGFILDSIEYSNEEGDIRADFNGEKSLKKKICINQIQKVAEPGDFRPYLHRMLEVFAEVPREMWHDPRIYSSGENERAKLESIVDSAVDILFTGIERDRIKNNIEQARLRMGKGWASIPRLNLGAIKLPIPGEKSALSSEFVMSATPYVVEYLHQLGIMSQQEAEDLAVRKLTNYFVHQSGFQLNRTRAKEIVSALQGRKYEVKTGVA